MTGRDAKTILVHGINTVLAGDNETTGKAKSLPCESLNQAPATILFLMTKCTMSTFLFLMTESTMTFPEFEVGQVWRTRGGDTCTIVLINKLSEFPIVTDLYGRHWYYSDGNSCLSDGNYKDDLVSLVKPVIAIDKHEKEPTPTTITMPDSTAPLLPQSIVNGDTPFYVVVAIDPDGEKLVWETPIPEETTLEAALKRRLRLNSRYSVSYIAECRIIPLLTQQS